MENNFLRGMKMEQFIAINNNDLQTVEGSFRNRKYYQNLTTMNKLILNDNLKIINDFKNNKYLGNTICTIMSNFTTEEISHLNNLIVENQKQKNYSQYTRKQLFALYQK